MFQVKGYTEIGLAALRSHDEACYRVWLLARYLDTIGNGNVKLADLRAFVEEHALFHPQSLWRAIQKGRGAWWILTPDHLHLYGLAKMARRLDVHLTEAPVLIPLDRLASIGSFRAALVASLFTRERTISQAALAAMTGRDLRTIISWIKRSRLTVTKNAMLSERPSEGPLDPELASQGYCHTVVGHAWRLVKRMPNTYQAPADFEPAPYGLVKHIECSSITTTGAKHRCYFDKPKSLLRALHRLDDEEKIYTPIGRTSKDGMRLWQGFQGVNGSFVVC